MNVRIIYSLMYNHAVQVVVGQDAKMQLQVGDGYRNIVNMQLEQEPICYPVNARACKATV